MAATRLSASLSEIPVLGKNPDRVMASFYNDTKTGNCYLHLGEHADIKGNYTVRIPPQALYELPVARQVRTAVWPGPIYAIWDVVDGAGALLVTEES